MTREYIKDVVIENNLVLVQGKINRIFAPCGTGKSTYFSEVLCEEYEPRRILYVVDTTMLKETMLNDHKGIMVLYDKTNMFTNRVPVMTYQKLGTILSGNTDFLNDYDLVVMDEAHNIIKYSHIGCEDVRRIADISASDESVVRASVHIHGCTYIREFLHKLIQRYNTKFLLMTATPSRVLNHELWQPYLYDVLKGRELQGYINKLTLEYKDNFRNTIPILQKYHNKDHKILVYSKRILACRSIKETFIKLGYNAECLFSVNSTSDTMTEEQLELRKYIIKNKVYPDNLDVLIINDAYETGWNLKDTRVQTVITNTTELDTAIQVRGRCRHDIALLINKGYNGSHNSNDDLLRVLKDYEGTKLVTKEDRQEILQELGRYNNRGKLIGWNTFKKEVAKIKGYTIKKSSTRIDGKSKVCEVIIKED